MAFLTAARDLLAAKGIACPVASNMFDSIWVEHPDGTLTPLCVDARGQVI